MKRKLSIQDVEKSIENLEFILCQPMQMWQWSALVSRWHALNIKLCAMRGESPIVTHWKPEHII